MDRAESLHIRNLVLLLGAESPLVRRKVRHELMQQADRLQVFLETFRPDYPPEMLYELEEVLHKHKHQKVHHSWMSWLQKPDTYGQLEAALTYLARIQPEAPTYPPLSQMLDKVVDDFLAEDRPQNTTSLNQYLFAEGRFKGAKDTYYHPLNSHLPHVIATQQGLPISLVCLLMLTGSRLGLDIYGFNLPGHFLARAQEEDRPVLFDCFNGGKQLSQPEMTRLSLSPRFDYKKLMTHPPSAPQIVSRILLNMVNAYYQSGSLDNYRQAQQLLGQLRTHLETQDSSEKAPQEPMFKAGQLVRHKRYGYRGVIVECDAACKADESWYRANLTQPRRDQPWYHVLVDCSTATTYAAQTSLEVDQDQTEIRHPLINLYFDYFQEGLYNRNETPWNMPS